MAQSSQFVIVRPQPLALSRLFCFPHAGGGAVSFFDWSGRLGDETECVSLQYAGRGQRLRERPRTAVHDLVAEIAQDFARWTDKPFAFYGHSFGGLVAFELARKLRRSGLTAPHHLFVGASRPPHLGLPFPPIHQLGDREFTENMQARYSGIPAVIFEEREMLEMFLPAMRADFTAYETYQCIPDVPLHLPITAFAGAEDKAVTPESIKEWALHTDGDFEAAVLPGGHFFDVSSGRELIDAVRARIAAHLKGERSVISA